MGGAVTREADDLVTMLGWVTSAAEVTELKGDSATEAVMFTAGNMGEGITDDTGTKLTWQGV